MTDALVLQHQDDAPAGLLLDALHRAGLTPTTVRLDRDDPLPDPGDVALAVSLGASASAADDGVPWVGHELAWLRGAADRGTALLGLCFGAQILARALGGSVVRDEHPERGWVTVGVRREGLLEPGPWLTWHDDSIHLPAGAQLLASNAAGVQAFAAGPHLGVQFHPEVTPEIIERWIEDDDGQSVDGPALRDQTSRCYPAAERAAARMFERFLTAALQRR